MLSGGFISELQHIVGETQVSVSRAGTELYSYDASLVKGQPGVVVFPGNTEEAARIVKITRQADIPFVPVLEQTFRAAPCWSLVVWLSACRVLTASSTLNPDGVVPCCSPV